MAIIFVEKPRKRYGFFRFLLDLFMILATGGLWIIWIFIREVRDN